MNLSRRAFIGGAALAGAGAAVSLVGCSSGSDAKKAEAKPESPSEEKKETAYNPVEVLTCDMVVVGAGISGMGAALEGKEQGLDVILVEKEAVPAGTMAGTEGIFGWRSQVQLDAGTELPKAYELVNEELEFANYRNDPLIIKQFINASGEDIDWLTSMGCSFAGVDDYLGQSTWNTFHTWENRTGAFAGEILGKKMVESGINVMLDTKALDLKSDNGAVVGLYVENAEGEVIEIDAKGVVLAAGGACYDTELLAEQTGEDFSNVSYVFPIEEWGDGINMGLSVGAKPTPISSMNVFTIAGYPGTDSIPIAVTAQPTGLWVNGNGERFINEDLIVNKFYAVTTNAYRVQDKVWCIADQKTIDHCEKDGIIYGLAQTVAGTKLEGLQASLDEAVSKSSSTVFKADTIEELAKAIGVDANALAATVSRYNEMCAAKEDDDCGKSPDFLTELEGPFYAAEPQICLFQTMGGIAIDRQGHVVDENDKPIPGLYSSGVMSCPLYKETYCYQVSGGMNAYCLFSGRNAARTIAASV